MVMRLMDRLLEQTKDYIGFRDLLFRLSSLNNEPLYGVITYLLHHEVDSMSFYNIDMNYKIIKFELNEFDTVRKFLEEIQNALSLTDEDWVWSNPASLDELSEYSRRAITTTVSKAMHCFFKKSDLLGFGSLNGLLHFEGSDAQHIAKDETVENPVDRRMEDNRRKYIAVNDFVNNLSKGRSFKEGGGFGAGNPLRITLEEILEKNLLNDINLYKLRGTEYLLVSQTDDFKYKNSADILRSIYNILDDDQTGTVKSDREPFEDFYFAYSEVLHMIDSDFKTLEKESSIHIDKQSSTNNPKSLDSSSVINNLGANQRLLATYALFTPEDLTCLLIDENPACISHNDNYLRHHHMVSNAVDAKLLTLNDEGKILAEQAKIWLASHSFVYKGFNDGTLTYADQLAEMKEKAIAANVKILNLTAKLEDAELDSIIHSHPAHKSLLSDAQATIEQLSKENAELRANKEASTSQPKYDDKVSDQTVEKLKKMTADYEELSLKYERINTQNKELLDKTEQHQQDNNEELIQHWEAERKKYQSKIEDLETVIEGFSDVETLSQDGDWQLYNWETMNVSQYPPELHLATEVWKRYYKASNTEDVTQFNTGKFNRITGELNLKDGKLKSRIRSILTPLKSKKTSTDLLATLRDVDILYNDKMPD